MLGSRPFWVLRSGRVSTRVVALVLSGVEVESELLEPLEEAILIISVIKVCYKDECEFCCSLLVVYNGLARELLSLESPSTRHQSH